MKTRQVHLTDRPTGKPKSSLFELAEVEVPILRENQVLVRNLYMSVDPYMRRSMEADGKDLEPWPIRGPLDGPAVGEVVESKNPDFTPGDIVESMSGWQEHFVSNGDAFVPYVSANTAIVTRRVGGNIEPKDYLGLLGIASMTGYFAISCAANPQPDQTLVVSSGAGTVGSVACQVGKNKGMRVVASAGSDSKIDWLINELGVDHAFNYKKTTYQDGLLEGCPSGIDLLLENVSSKHLSACLPLMNYKALILIAGFISIYSTGGKSGRIENFEYVLDSYLTLKGYEFMDYMEHYGAFIEDMTAWRDAGSLIFNEKIHQGLENAPDALASLFSSKSFGKNLVAI